MNTPVMLCVGVALMASRLIVSASSDRFSVIMDGGAVKDNGTGLVWEREPSSSHMIWSDAPGHCEGRTSGGQGGWRLPTVKELSGLVDASQMDPALAPDHPFLNIKSAIYWSATPSETDEIVAWHVSFYRGEAVTDQKSQTRRVWCVRDTVTGAGK
jgi:Protein of unknown function (DUF1566)